MHPILILIISSSTLLCLVIFKLVAYCKNGLYLNIALIISLSAVIWYGLIFILTNLGMIIRYPILFNKGLPFYYLIGPGIYLFIRGLLYPHFRKFRYTDLLHLALTVPAIMSIIPYNFASYAIQQWVVTKVSEDPSFAFSNSRYIVGSWHWFTFPLSALVYNFSQLGLIFKAAKKQLVPKSQILWLAIFTGISILIFGGMLGLNFNLLFSTENLGSILESGNLVFFVSASLLAFSASFFMNNELMFGLKKINVEPEQAKPQSIVSSNQRPNFENIQIKMYDEKLTQEIERYIHENEIFRNEGLTVSELASMIRIPNHKLSDFFNNHYKVNFNSYINNLRINYAKQRLDEGDWKQFTLEAIAQESGFTSRNTFALSFKKTMGVTPSQYVSELKSQSA